MMKKLMILGLMLNMPFQVCLGMNDDALRRAEQDIVKQEERERLDPLEQERQAAIQAERQRQEEHEEAMRLIQELQEEERRTLQALEVSRAKEERARQQIEESLAIQRQEEQEQQELQQALVQSRRNTPAPAQLTEEQALAQALAESKQVTEKEAAKIMPAGINATTLQNKKLNRVITIKQLALDDHDRQEAEDITCGPRTLFIADAINKIVKDHRNVTPETLRTELAPSDYHAEIHQCLAKNKQLASTDFGPFMQEQNITIPNLFLLGSQGNDVIPLAKSEAEELNFEALIQIPDQLHALRTQLATLTDPVHFICTDAHSGHWFLFSVIPQNGQPQIWYIDPKNVRFAEYKQALKFLTYIVQHLIPEQDESLGASPHHDLVDEN